MNRFAPLVKILSQNLHFLYLVYIIPLAYLTISLTPPYQNPDEPNHLARAEQVAQFDFVPHFIHTPSTLKDTSLKAFQPDEGGFMTDKGINLTYQFVDHLNFRSEVKISGKTLDSARTIKWGQNGTVLKNFGNTAIYPPVVYAMPAFGVALGKAFAWPVVKTLYVARSLNALLAVVLGFLTIKYAKRSKFLLFTGLLVPMIVSVYCSVTQDATLISCSFLLIALLDHVENGSRIYQTKHIVAVTALLAIIAVAKPPYILFAAIVPFLKMDLKAKIIGIAVPLVILFGWIFINSANFALKFAPAELHYSSRLQLQYIFGHPFKFMGLFFQFDGSAIRLFFRRMIGILGWLDLEFAGTYYRVTYYAFVLGFIAFFNRTIKDSLKLRIALFVITAVTCVAILTAQYVTWVEYKSPSLGGMQGRYFLPIFPFLALALTSAHHWERENKFKLIVTGLLMLYPIYTALTMVSGIVHRYYI